MHDADEAAAAANLPVRADDGRYVKGVSGNPLGRPQGVRNRLSETFLRDVLASWETEGAMALATVCRTAPLDYLKLVATLLPKNFNVKVNEFDDLTDEQLMRQLVAIRAECERSGICNPQGTAEAPAPQPSRLLQALSEAG